MSVPSFMPVLSRGSHFSPKDGACLMEYCSLLAGEEWSDHPACTHPVLAAAARRVNDGLPDSERHLLVPMIGRLLGTAPTGTAEENHRLSVQLAVWSARRVLHLVRPADRPKAEAAISAAQAWLNGTGSVEEHSADAATAAAYAAYATATAAAYAATAAAYAAAAYAATAADAAAAAATAAAYAATAYAYVTFLDDLLTYHAELTGHTARPLTTDEQRVLVTATT